MKTARILLLPLALGIVGMFLAHFVILTGFMLGTRLPLYFAAYPTVYCFIALILTWVGPKYWLSHSILIHALPSLYWYLLMWRDGKMHLQAALDFHESSQMLTVVPISLGLSCLAAFILSRLRRAIHP